MAILAIDFDDTIFCYDEEGTPQLIKGARECLQELKEAGHTIIIYSCRPGLAFEREGKNGLEMELDWMAQILSDYQIPFDEIFSERKLVADLYIDDRGIRYESNWDEINQKIKKLTKE